MRIHVVIFFSQNDMYSVKINWIKSKHKILYIYFFFFTEIKSCIPYLEACSDRHVPYLCNHEGIKFQIIEKLFYMLNCLLNVEN